MWSAGLMWSVNVSLTLTLTLTLKSEGIRGFYLSSSRFWDGDSGIK